MCRWPRCCHLFPFRSFSFHKNPLPQNVPNSLPKHGCSSLKSLLWPSRGLELDTLLSFSPGGTLNAIQIRRCTFSDRTCSPPSSCCQNYCFPISQQLYNLFPTAHAQLRRHLISVSGQGKLPHWCYQSPQTPFTSTTVEWAALLLHSPLHPKYLSKYGY